MSKKINWGIIGSGNIAGTLAKAIHQSETANLYGVASRSQEKADEFAKKHEVEKGYGTYQSMLEDDHIDAVYISLPNHMHAEWSIACAREGKGILCEKPITLNAPEAEALFQEVSKYDVCLMEAFMYRCHPQSAKISELLRAGEIGEVRMIDSVFCYNMGLDLDNIRLSNTAGGGAIMDVGCYTTSMTRLIAGAGLGTDIAEPLTVHGAAHIGDQSRVDEQATGTMHFEGGIVASLACASQCNHQNQTRVFGSEGSLEISNPWFPEESSKLIIKKEGDTQEVEIPASHSAYVYEVNLMAEYIEKGLKEAPAPAMTWKDSIGNMKALDAWRESVGLSFDTEK